jgi:hypothetical protein
MDACSKIGPVPVIPDTGTLEDDVTALATGLSQQLKSARWAAVLPSIIDAAEREPELAQLLAELHAGQMAPYFAVAERAPGTNVSEFVASIVAPFFYRRWFTREPLDDAFVQGGVRCLLTQLKIVCPPVERPKKKDLLDGENAYRLALQVLIVC